MKSIWLDLSVISNDSTFQSSTFSCTVCAFAAAVVRSRPHKAPARMICFNSFIFGNDLGCLLITLVLGQVHRAVECRYGDRENLVDDGIERAPVVIVARRVDDHLLQVVVPVRVHVSSESRCFWRQDLTPAVT